MQKKHAKLKNYFQSELYPEAGIDEAGRGCLAGPVVAAAVILPKNHTINGLKDSKKLTAKQRELLQVQILEQALAWSIGEISPTEIDKINILQATFSAMHQALDTIKVKPKFICVDGNLFRKWQTTPHQCIIKGDNAFSHIAAAGILAKVHRDERMREYHQKHPQYEWDKNKGYGTKKHILAIQRFGKVHLHRQTFNFKIPP